MANIPGYPAPQPTARFDLERVEQPVVSQHVPHERHERHPYPCQRAYVNFRSRILNTLTKPRQSRIVNGLQRTARTGFLILDTPARWLMDLCDAVSGNRGYLAVGTVLAAYLAVFGLVDTKSTQEETHASVERSIFMTLVSANNTASFVTAMQDFGRIQKMPVTEHPSLLKFWQWGGNHHPNREPLWSWALRRLGACGKNGAKDCSLKEDTRLDLKQADLSHAELGYTDLHNADLDHARLTHADLLWVNLNHADLRHADLDHAALWVANLSGADLRQADLDHAQLDGASLIGADLRDVTDWSGADLSNADLSGANLRGGSPTQAQLDQACGDNVKLDPGLTIKPCPPQAR